MRTGDLTPRAGGIVKCARFSGDFGQPNGFKSVLTADIRQSGEACIQLHYKAFSDQTELQWAVMLTNEQRKELGRLLLDYEPTLWEYIKEPGA